MSLATRSRVIDMWRSGLKLTKTQERLREEDVIVSKQSLCMLIIKHKQTGSVRDNRTRRRPKQLKDAHYRFIDMVMADIDELPAPKLTSLLKEKYPELANVSLSTVKRARRELGWVAKKTRYCALVSAPVWRQVPSRK